MRAVCQHQAQLSVVLKRCELFLCSKEVLIEACFRGFVARPVVFPEVEASQIWLAGGTRLSNNRSPDVFTAELSELPSGKKQ